MFGFLPNPHITAITPQEQIEQINNYLFQLKQELELMLMDISEENLSDSLLKRIKGIDNNIDTNKKEQTEINEVLASRELKVTDVVNSKIFQNEIAGFVTEIAIDYETGELSYETKGEKDGTK